ncbi:hypothetical protein [Paenibacillus sp. YYML68]|uniref:hypothetical protein n=1 Tax=Paenibacillus sp. YYML68 TaxID=2909250 RepID=UPI002493075F|nr:hypothetical protein [Paenibacillus sp. YYML68]
MLITAAQQSNSSNAYANAIASVSSFVTWIESQSVAPYPSDAPYNNADTAFTKTKQDAIEWYNVIYPSCIQVLNSIQSLNPQVTGGINTLQSLAAQYASQPDNEALHTAIVSSCNQVKSLVAGIYEQSNKLQQGLSSFQDHMNADFASLNASYQALMIELQNQQNQLSSLYGQLHSLESKTCPSDSDIQACKSQIQSKQNLINQIQQLYSLIGNALSQASSASQGISYMLQFWSVMTANTQTVMSALDKVAADPAVLVKLDLTYALESWNNLVQFATQNYDQLPANLQIG